jgi:hypothetical protein
VDQATRLAIKLDGRPVPTIDEKLEYTTSPDEMV